MEYIILIYCLSFLISNILIIKKKENDEGYAFIICVLPIVNTFFIIKEMIKYIIHIKFTSLKFSLKRLYDVFKK